jgi:succinyl-CoA synthetase beta subunit
VVDALNLLESDDRVKCILINCYGGNLHMEDLMTAVLTQLEKGFSTKKIVMRVYGLGAQKAVEMFQ